MAQSNNTTLLSRRTALGSIAAASALSLPVLASSGSVASRRALPDPEFISKCQLWRDAKASLDALYAHNETLTDALDCQRPLFPMDLTEPLAMPHGRQMAPEGGWKADELTDWAQKGYDKRFVRTTDAEDNLTLTEVRKPICTATRQRAGELLLVREKYDQQHDAWWTEVKAIEETTHEPVTAAYDALADALCHPVTRLEDIACKIEMAAAGSFFECSGEEQDQVREAMFRDMLAIAGQAPVRVSSSIDVDQLPVDGTLAMEVIDKGCEPAYCKGAKLLVASGHSIATGDRVIVKTTSGVTIIGEVTSQHDGCWHVAVFPDLNFRRLVYEHEIEWSGKIMWASQ